MDAKESARSRLLTALVTHAYQYSDEPVFKLVSGALSHEYLDCKMALSQPAAMVALGEVVHAALLPGVVAVGGLTMGSDPIANATCQHSAGTDQPVRWFSVPKDAKAHGRKKRIEGDVSPGQRVAVVDDVVTAGGSVLQAVQACTEFGLEVAQVIVLVDREQDEGMRRVREGAGGAPVTAVFTKSEIRAAWARRRDAGDPKRRA